MATVCKEHGAESRLRCVSCEAPICRDCLVPTKVGFKCPEHGRMTVSAPRAAGQPPERESGRRRRGGSPSGRMGFLPIFLFMFVGFPILTVGLGALFAVTADATGFVAVLPLLAVFVLLAVGGLVVGRRLTRF